MKKQNCPICHKPFLKLKKNKMGETYIHENNGIKISACAKGEYDPMWDALRNTLKHNFYSEK